MVGRAAWRSGGAVVRSAIDQDDFVQALGKVPEDLLDVARLVEGGNTTLTFGPPSRRRSEPR